MGLIEDLRRKRAKEEELEKQRTLIKQAQNIALSWQQEKTAIEKKHLKVLRGEAEKRFQKSGLWEIITLVSKLGGGNPWNYGDDSKGIYKCGIVISEEKIPDKYWFGGETGEGVIKEEKVEIEIDSWGTIKFRGGIFGSSTVRQSTWEQDGNVLEEALGRVYNNPKLERKRYYRPSSDEPRGGG